MSEKENGNEESNKKEVDDEALEKLAAEELMREAVQGAARAELVGPSGWVQAQQQKANKRFLVNTIRNTVASNNYNRKVKESNSKRRSPKREHRSHKTIKKHRSRKH